jgi:hypothetical protein
VSLLGGEGGSDRTLEWRRAMGLERGDRWPRSGRPLRDFVFLEPAGFGAWDGTGSTTAKWVSPRKLAWSDSHDEAGLGV